MLLHILVLHNLITVFIATAPGKNNEITLSKKVGVSFQLSKRSFCWYWPIMGHQGSTLSQSSHNRLTHFLARSFDTFCSCCLVTKSCPALCDPMDCSFFVLHYLLEFAQIHVCSSVMISNHLFLCQPLLLCLQSFPASTSFPVSQLFSSGGQRIGASPIASVLPVNIQS